jgi:putative acetyltransferase
MITIRPERTEDQPGIYRVNELAFYNPDKAPPVIEAELVNRLREADAIIQSLVAEEDGEIVGHVLFSPALIQVASLQYLAVALAPLAVLPAYQRKGIGAQLTREGIDLLRREGHQSIFLHGHPEYYPRFGFVPAASTYGIHSAEFDAPDPVFMALELQPKALKGKEGLFYYHPIFGGG